jgi:hypothetical protein
MIRLTKFLIFFAAVASISIASIAAISSASDVTPLVSPSASPSPRPTATAIPPAGSATVAWAHRWQKSTRRAYQHWTFARRCWGTAPAPVSLSHPRLSQPNSVWNSYVARMKLLIKRFNERYDNLLYAARHPGGSGATRWWPLARFMGWPPSERSNFILCVTGESGGSASASNGVCRGLMQVHECHAADFRRVTGLPYFNGVYVPSANLKYGLRLWKAGGWGPWTTM